MVHADPQNNPTLFQKNSHVKCEFHFGRTRPLGDAKHQVHLHTRRKQQHHAPSSSSITSRRTVSFDFKTLADNKATNVEAIDITDSGNNTLKLSTAGVLNILDTRSEAFAAAHSNNGLVVEGNASNALNLFNFDLYGAGSFRAATWQLAASDVGLDAERHLHVIDSRHTRIRRLNPSTTSVRYTKPRAIGIYVMSILVGSFDDERGYLGLSTRAIGLQPPLTGDQIEGISLGAGFADHGDRPLKANLADTIDNALEHLAIAHTRIP